MATTAKTRRPHRKSRNGCAECKHRHIRCDERRPSCANCEAAERMCSFLKSQANKQKQKQGQPYRTKQQQRQDATAATSLDLDMSGRSNVSTVQTTDSEHLEPDPRLFHHENNPTDLGQALEQLSHYSTVTRDSLLCNPSLGADSYQIPSPASPMVLTNSSTPPADCCPGLSTVSNAVSKAIFTPQHMVLMHYTDTVPDLTRPNRNVVDIAVRRAIDSPYLLDEVLAFTAFHMASLYPASATYLRCLATELQNRALASFTQLTKLVSNDDKATAAPRFLFSAILGRHVLADTLTHSHADFRLFIDRFVECINLNRGIKAVTPPARDFLHGSEIEPFIRVVREAEGKIISSRNECDPLSRVMDDSDLNEASINACRQAIEVLQWSFDLCHGLDEEDYLQAASVFSVRIGADYVDVLRKHRPEALLILAYYGVLLYRCRNFWAFRDAGASMIRAIDGRLGSYWQDALAWPLHVLEAEHNSEPLTLPS